MKLCVNCGNELGETARFCTNCGEAVTGEKTQTIQTTAPTEMKEPESKVDEETETSGHIYEPVETKYVVNEKESSPISLEDGFEVISNYGHFFKDTLVQPTSIFTEANGQFWNGLISLLLLGVGLAFISVYPFFEALIRVVFLQLVLLGTLFAVSKVFYKANESFLDALELYGGLLQGQIVLTFIFLMFQEAREGTRIFFALFLLLNQLNIFNIYLRHVKKGLKLNIDPFYHLIIVNIMMITVFLLVIVLIG